MTDLADIRRQYKPGANEAIDYLLNRVTHRDLELQRLRGLLKRLEWASKDDSGYGRCPVCDAPEGFTHWGEKPPPDRKVLEPCWLWVELRST